MKSLLQVLAALLAENLVLKKETHLLEEETCKEKHIWRRMQV
jgi:hypothetical protein